MKVPLEIANRIELTNILSSERPRPIATPTGVDRANENIRQLALPQVKPAVKKLPPRDTDAMKLWIPILMKRNEVVARSCYMPRAIPSKILWAISAITSTTPDVLVKLCG